MTAAIDKAAPGSAMRQEAPIPLSRPAVPDKEESGRLFRHALQRSHEPSTASGEGQPPAHAGVRDEKEPPPSAVPALSVPPPQPRTRMSPAHDEAPVPSSAAPAAPPLYASADAARPLDPVAPAPQWDALFARLDSVIPGVARSDLHMPGDQWIAQHVTVAQGSDGLLLSMDMGKDGQNQDALDDLLKRLRARGITARFVDDQLEQRDEASR